MKIKLAIAAHNTEKCFESGIYGTDDVPAAVKLSELVPGDILIFYKNRKGFAGIYKVTESYYRDTTQIWDDGIYPNRIKIEPIISLNPEKYLDVKTIVNDLEMVKHPLYYGLAFRRNLVDISQKDFELIKSKMEQSSKK